MRNLLIASVALIGLSATAAYAGEGNGNPFPGPDAAVTSRIGSHPYATKDQDPYQFRVAGTTSQVGSVKLSVDHSQDPFQYRVAGSQIGGSDNPSLASRDQSPTATNARTEAAAPRS